MAHETVKDLWGSEIEVQAPAPDPEHPVRLTYHEQSAIATVLADAIHRLQAAAAAIVGDGVGEAMERDDIARKLSRLQSAQEKILDALGDYPGDAS